MIDEDGQRDLASEGFEKDGNLASSIAVADVSARREARLRGPIDR